MHGWNFRYFFNGWKCLLHMLSLNIYIDNPHSTWLNELKLKNIMQISSLKQAPMWAQNKQCHRFFFDKKK